MAPKKDERRTTVDDRHRWGANIHTISSIDPFNTANDNDGSTNSNNPQQQNVNTPNKNKIKFQHVLTLPNATHAQKLLERIQSEFQILIQKRGFHITSVTEMCCCEDGLDYLPTKNGTKKRGRKTRTMPDNVLGYNLTTGTRGGGGKSVHRIHLRLRIPRSHGFYPYEDIAGTMCHELAHCIRGPHDAKFYKAMDEIMEQHAVFLARGIVADTQGFPINSSQSYTLGHGGNGSGSHGVGNGTFSGTKSMAALAYQAAQRRIQQRQLGGTHVLGSKSNATSSSSSSTSSLKHLPPMEAARIAAERRIKERRIQDSKYCLPCNEVIEILDESSSEEEDNMDSDNDVKQVKAASDIPKKGIQNDSCTSQVISLLDSSDDDDDDDDMDTKPPAKLPTIIDVDDDDDVIIPQRRKKKSSKKKRNKARSQQTLQQQSNDSSSINNPTPTPTSPNHDSIDQKWTCVTCTFVNKPMALACEMCREERSFPVNDVASAATVNNDINGDHSNKKDGQTKQVIEQILKEDRIENVKQDEVVNSHREYGGFNIYKSDKHVTR